MTDVLPQYPLNWSSEASLVVHQLLATIHSLSLPPNYTTTKITPRLSVTVGSRGRQAAAAAVARLSLTSPTNWYLPVRSALLLFIHLLLGSPAYGAIVMILQMPVNFFLFYLLNHMIGSLVIITISPVSTS